MENLASGECDFSTCPVLPSLIARLLSLLAWLTFNDFSNFSLGCLHSFPPLAPRRSLGFSPVFPPPHPLSGVVVVLGSSFKQKRECECECNPELALPLLFSHFPGSLLFFSSLFSVFCAFAYLENPFVHLAHTHPASTHLCTAIIGFVSLEINIK